MLADLVGLSLFVVHTAALQPAGDWRLLPPGPLRPPTAIPPPRLADFVLTTRSPLELHAPLRWSTESLLDRRFPAIRPSADAEDQVILGMAF
jgi:hypothetical protein